MMLLATAASKALGIVSGQKELPHVAVLFARIGPYHFARLKAAGNRLRVSALECSNVDATYAWAPVEGADHFARVALFPDVALETVSGQLLSARMFEVLDQLRPQAVAIPGWSDRCALAALQWCCDRRVPAVLLSETTAWDESRRWWKEGLKRRIVGCCTTGLVGGRAHADYLEQLGLGRKQVFLGYDAVDNAYFATKAAEASEQRAALRKQHELPEQFFLASARFVEKKNLVRLFQAYARYRTLLGPARSWPLVLLGDGPLRATLYQLRSSLGLEAFIQLPGFKQYDELPLYYGLASAFVHASTVEQWGLVVNEAMASGLPVLVSERCGCALDLVQDGVNGFTFDPDHIEHMAQALVRLTQMSPAQLASFGAASRNIIADWGSDRFANGLEQAVNRALSLPSSRARWADRQLLKLLLRRQ